jgi:uncharacterized membrane protein YqjE
MAAPAASQQAGGDAEQSLGGLVSVAVKDLTQLVRCELDLAKMELKNDAVRIGVGGGLIGVAAFVGCLALVLVSFAFAYGLVTLGIWIWAAFLIAAGTWVLLGALAVLIGYLRFRHVTGFRQTRRTVAEDIAMMRRDNGATAPPAGGVG